MINNYEDYQFQIKYELNRTYYRFLHRSVDFLDRFQNRLIQINNLNSKNKNIIIEDDLAYLKN